MTGRGWGPHISNPQTGLPSLAVWLTPNVRLKSAHGLGDPSAAQRHAGLPARDLRMCGAAEVRGRGFVGLWRKRARAELGEGFRFYNKGVYHKELSFEGVYREPFVRKPLYGSQVLLHIQMSFHFFVVLQMAGFQPLLRGGVEHEPLVSWRTTSEPPKRAAEVRSTFLVQGDEPLNSRADVPMSTRLEIGIGRPQDAAGLPFCPAHSAPKRVPILRHTPCNLCSFVPPLRCNVVVSRKAKVPCACLRW